MRPGDAVGPYRIVAGLGVGGMGEVYRARDSKLQRDVAIKVLPPAMAAHPRRLVRFEREARALAALNHPNIATVYGVEDPSETDGHGHALVMELVEGEDLSWRLKRGPLPLAEALSIARQVADALAAAHDAGIVHRDLKPSNIKVREDGTVKVLDFGLATGRAGDADVDGDGAHDAPSGSGSGWNSASGSGELPNTVTLHGDLTEDGAVIGTAAYMAPEQAKGKPVDKRADIWAFGVVLFEMLAGRRPFESSDAADLVARILAAEPDWQALPAATPRVIRRLLARCLAKDRRRRLHDIADARLDLDDALTPSPEDSPVPPPETRIRAVVRLRWIALAVLALAGGIAIGLLARRAPGADPVAFVRLDLSPASELNAGGVHPSIVLPAAGSRTALAWTPDGRALAFIGVRDGVRQIYLRDLSSSAAQPVAGTEGAGAFAISPAGDEVAFWTGRGISKVKLTGGPITRICDTGTVTGLSWGAARIVFVEAPALVEVSPAGGTKRQLTEPPELVRHASPHLLPGDAALLYTEFEKQWTSGDERVMLLPLQPGAKPRLLLRAAADARYLPSGHLAFLRQGTLFVVPFDLRTLELRGDPVAVLNDVAQAVVAWDSDDLTLAGQFAVSPRGTMAFVARPPTTYPDRELVAIDRRGSVTPLGAPVRGYRNHVALSPDGSRLAVTIQTSTDIRCFAYDLVRGTLARLAESVTGEVIVAAWSKDNRIAVQAVDGGRIMATIVRTDVASPAEPVDDSTGFWASSWSPDGQLVGMKSGHLWIYEPGQTRRPPAAFVPASATETQPMWSPDGRFLAYTSNATGRLEVYVRPYRGPGDAVMVSTNGGSSPAWNPGGRELFYVEPAEGRDRMMAVRLDQPSHPGSPVELFSVSRPELLLGPAILTPYAVAPGGSRFYAVRNRAPAPRPVGDVSLILNWADELKAKLASAAHVGGR